jgi:hypothetical protein
VSIQRWVGVIYDDPEHPEDERADHVAHRVVVHGESPLVCFPVRRPGGADGVLASDWDAICEALRNAHTSAPEA